MSLTIAARKLGKTVRSTERLCLRYTENGFPQHGLTEGGQLDEWVQFKLASQELALVNEVSLEIAGEWSNYRFPRPLQASNTENLKETMNGNQRRNR